MFGVNGFTVSSSVAFQAWQSHDTTAVRTTELQRLVSMCYACALTACGCNSADGARILLGTAGCELYEMSAADGSIIGSGTSLVSGHGGSISSSNSSSSSSISSSNITKSAATAAKRSTSSSASSASSSGATGALAVHPGRAEYVTGGADGAIRVWDALSR
jgi:WD40 repeat protein